MFRHCVVLKELQSDVKVKKLMGVLQKHTELKLDDFKTMDDVYRYVDAIVTSGSSEEAKGCVFVLGNTSVGKSSLIQTLRKYCKDTTKTPKPVLTGADENKALLETRVLDLVENILLRQKTQTKLEIRKENPKDKLGIIAMEEEPSEEPTQQSEEGSFEQIQTSFVDFGGHTEYASCSPIFMKEKGVFLICFPVDKFRVESALDDEYFSSIGTYIQLVMENCETPIIFLVATKGNLVTDSTVRDCLSSVLTTAKEHLETIAKRNKNKNPLIFDRVFEAFLSQGDAKLETFLDDLMSNLVAVFGHCDLMDVKLRAVPKSWRKTIDSWKSTQQLISIENAVLDYQRIIEEEVTDEMGKWKIAAAEKLVKSAEEEERSSSSARQNQCESITHVESSTDGANGQDSDLTEEIHGIEHRTLLETFRRNFGLRAGHLGALRTGKRFDEFLSCSCKRSSEEEEDLTDTKEEDIPHLETFDLGAQVKSEDRKEVEGILTLFSSNNEILWFR